MQAYIFFYNAMIKCVTYAASTWIYVLIAIIYVYSACCMLLKKKKIININFAFVFQAESVLFVVLSDSGSDLTGSSAFGTDVLKCYLWNHRLNKAVNVIAWVEQVNS